MDPGGPAGSSRSTTPSSAATSVASAVTGFETEASRNASAARRRVVARGRGPDRRRRRPRIDGPAVDLVKACTRAILAAAMERRLISGTRRTSRSSATRAPSSSATACTSRARRRSRPTDRRRPRASTSRRASACEIIGDGARAGRRDVSRTSSGRGSTSTNADDFDGRRARPRRGLRRHPTGEHDRRRQPPRPALEGGDRGRGGAAVTRQAGVPVVDHGQGRGAGRAASPTTVRAGDAVHARRRGGVHAARRRDVRSRTAHRDGARRRRGARARAADQRRADAVGARDRDARLPHRRATRCAG